ncbi:MAG: hypothetical protein ACREMX_11325 [Gemmatimonadales bacterium]
MADVHRIPLGDTMYSHMGMKLRHKSSAGLLSVLALTMACAGDGARAQRDGAGSRATVKTQPFESDPCAWVTPAEVERLVGRLQSAPRRGKSAENPVSQVDGKACVYEMAGAGPDAEVVALQVDLESAMTYETANAMVFGAVSGLVTETVRAELQKNMNSAPPEGWDYFAEGAGGTVFRTGHMAIIVGMYTPRLFTGDEQRDKAIALAGLVRERVPDLPVAAEYGDPNAEGRGPDPCALVTREEAEAFLGKLMVTPYRSKKTTPFADGTGQACTYYRGNHRVLVLTPYWSDGRELFGLASGLTEEITSKLGVGEQSADTLEGSWDQSKADIDGTLNFLNGDRMLEVKYRTAGIDQAGALRLATIAVNRLKAAP